MNIYLVRHGETLFNRLKKNQGWIDSDLTKEGIVDLKSKFQQVHFPYFDEIYCSDLNRAKNTLSILLNYVNYNSEFIFYDKNLRERFLGSFEGDYQNDNRNKIAKHEGYSSFEDMMNKISFWEFVDITKKHDQNNLAEDFLTFSSRVEFVIDNITQSIGDKNILIVSHANPIEYMVEYLADENNQLEINNGSIIKCSKIKNEWKIKQLI